MPANYWEASARALKVERLVSLLESAEVTDLGASQFSADDWKLASTAAGTRIPSPTTCQAVVEELRQRRLSRERKPAAMVRPVYRAEVA